MSKCSLNFILHAHLPYIKHTRDPYHIEQKWLYESIAESYIPLLNTLHALAERGMDFHITLSLSPTLCMMLQDRELQEGCEAHLNNLIALAESECRKNRNTPPLHALSCRYLREFRKILELYSGIYGKDLLQGFRALRDRGMISLITTAATHSYLPLLEDYPEALNAQIQGGLEIFSRVAGAVPAGFWLPECGYSPEIEEALDRCNIRFSIIEGHGIVFSRPFASYGVYRPVKGHSGVVLFGRDSEISQLVWSAESGYPADPDYRDFYDDLVYGLPESEVKKYIHPDGIRAPSGIKYKRITGEGEKEYYDPRRAERKTDFHAAHFISKISETSSRVHEILNIDPLITVAFDAELFGHWWHEGCLWLEKMISRISRAKDIGFTSCDRSLQESPAFETVFPEKSSWGYKGYSETWINPKNDWMIRYIHRATELVIRLVRTYGNDKGNSLTKALNSAVREVFLLQSSDWSFLLDRGISESYIRKRFMTHYERVSRISRMIEEENINPDSLGDMETEEGPFAETDYRWFLAT
jgi:1,4-alpha-glucan branching enzyme